jgi:pilus assembly protein Flp/PilA
MFDYVKMMIDLYSPVTEEEEGQGMVEYGLILALVSIVAVGALFLMGGTVTDVFNDIVAELGGGGGTD